MRKIILSLLGILLVGFAVFFSKKLIADRHKPKPVKEKVVKTVFVDTVKNTRVKIIVPANGRLEAKRRVAIYAEVQGVFKSGSKLYKPGQTYKKGQVLIAVNAQEFYASVQVAKSNFYNAIAAIMPDLRLDFPGVFPKWQRYLNSIDLNKSIPKLPETTTDKEKYFISGRQIVSTYYHVKNLEQRLLKYTIKAPFSGILTEALVTQGDLIRPGQKLGTLINPSVYEMEVALSENDAKVLKVGEVVNLNNLDNTAQYKGVVTRINGSLDASTQTVSAYIDVKDPNLKEGIYLEANLNANSIENAIQINRSLLTEAKEIFVVKDSVLDVLKVNPVYYSKTKVVIKNIPNGTIILKKNIPGAYAGMLVKPLKQDAK